MNTLQIHTPEGQTDFEPGAPIDVDVSWDFESPPESLELRVVWNTAGKGTTDLSVVQSQTIESPTPRDSRRLTIALPSAPYSFSGKLVSLIWALELVALPGKESTRQEIVVAPAGREVVLRPVEKPGREEWEESV
jgi:hypothetical protein